MFKRLNFIGINVNFMEIQFQNPIITYKYSHYSHIIFHIIFQNPVITYKYSLQLNFSEYLILIFNYRFCSF